MGRVDGDDADIDALFAETWTWEVGLGEGPGQLADIRHFDLIAAVVTKTRRSL